MSDPLVVTATTISEPLNPIRPPEKHGGPVAGIGLCLSGGGYRAMLFHLGTLWRLADGGVLPRLNRISSVSGGSLTSAVLAVNWNSIVSAGANATRMLVEKVVQPIRNLANRTIDAGAIIGGILLPGSVAEKVADAYEKYLFGGKTLADLPDEPRFVFNATNVQTGALWRFSKPHMADYHVGLIKNPTVKLSQVVAASSAFPPILSPVELDLNPADFEPGSGLDLQREPFTNTAVLTDGGVYDNLGLETVWKRYRTVLVSDAGGKLDAESDPKRDWGRHAVRVLELIDNQVRCLRKRQLVAAYIDQTDEHDGAYWGIRSDIMKYPVSDKFQCQRVRALELADTPTRLKQLPPERQERLINWGFAICDAAIRSHFDRTLSKPIELPYPNAGI